MESIASLFRFKYQFPGRFATFYEKVEDNLLDFTVHEAYNQSEFYHRVFPELREDDYIDKEKLKNLPLLFRQQVEEAGRSICSKAVAYGFSSYTEGTTTRNTLIIDRSIQEQKFVLDFFSIVNQYAGEDTKLVLSLAIPCHGNVLLIPGKNISIFPVTTLDENRFNQAIKLLKRRFKINGEERAISCISGSLEGVAKFTAYLLHKGITGLEENIRQIQTGEAYMTRYVSEWLKDFWKCEIMNYFSFAELPFTAFRCRECGLYHFDSYGIPEILELPSNRPIKSGRGRLFVTSLYPFTQMTPLIRYCTGDLVDIKEINCPHGKYGYIFLGREYNSLIFKKEYSGYTFLSAGEVYEALDGIPDINTPKMEYFSSCCHSIGHMPVFWFDNDPRNIIHIELRYSPVFYPGRLNELTDIIKTRLISQCDWLEGMFKKQLISLKFHPPESSGKDSVYRP